MAEYISKVVINSEEYQLGVDYDSEGVLNTDKFLNKEAFTGASDSTNGAMGAVPAPAAGDEGKYLRGDGTWGEVNSCATILRVWE